MAGLAKDLQGSPPASGRAGMTADEERALRAVVQAALAAFDTEHPDLVGGMGGLAPGSPFPPSPAHGSRDQGS